MSLHHNDYELLDEQTSEAQSENREINNEEGQSLLRVEKEEELNTAITAENNSNIINNADRKSYGAIPVGMDHGKDVNEVNTDGNSSASKDTSTNKARLNMTADESWTLDETTIFSDNSNEFSATTPTSKLRRLAIDLSLYFNLAILISKLAAYLHTLSLSVLAALTDSLLDVISQLVLNYTEKNSTKSRSSALYPAGAARLEPLGVLICAALMGMASFEIVKQSIESLLYDGKWKFSLLGESSTNSGSYNLSDELMDGQNMAAVWGMASIVFVKLALYMLCMKAIPEKEVQSRSRNIIYANRNNNSTNSDEVDGSGDSAATTATAAISATAEKKFVKVSDPTLEALAQDHWNDALSNAVAAIALCAALASPDLWFLDPVGAIIISLYIIYSWYETGKEQIEQLTGKSAPDEFIDELYELASTFDRRMIVDVVRAYHFGPKFLVELEVVLPKDTLLFESHDLGMELQYEIESRDEVERCFVHIDYEQRPYDEHVVSKVPELRAKYRPSASGSIGSNGGGGYGNHSV
jgi:cation diffusion facilitator family transporter